MWLKHPVAWVFSLSFEFFLEFFENSSGFFKIHFKLFLQTWLFISIWRISISKYLWYHVSDDISNILQNIQVWKIGMKTSDTLTFFENLVGNLRYLEFWKRPWVFGLEFRKKLEFSPLEFSENAQKKACSKSFQLLCLEQGIASTD